MDFPSRTLADVDALEYRGTGNEVMVAFTGVATSIETVGGAGSTPWSDARPAAA